MLSQLPVDKIDANFPFESYRDGQREAIEFAVNAFNSGKKYVIIEAPTGAGKCLHADSLLLLANGERVPISAAGSHIGAELHGIGSDLRNTTCRLIAHCYSGVKDCFELITRSGRRIVATGDHRFYRFGGWAKLSEIVIGDHLATNWQLDVRTDGTDRIGCHEAELIGLLLGDGRFRRHCTEICISDDEPEVKDRVEQLIRIIHPDLRLHVNPKCTRKGKNYAITLNESRANPGAPAYRPNPVNELIQRLGLTGKVKEHKFIPDAIFASSLEVWVALLSGLWQSDGWVAVHSNAAGRRRRTSIGFTNRSYALAQGAQHLLLRLGIRSDLKRRQMLCTTSGKRFPSHQLEISADSQLRFLDVFGDELAAIGCPTTAVRELRESAVSAPRWDSNSMVPAGVVDVVLSEIKAASSSWYHVAPPGLAKAGPNLYRRRGNGLSRRSLAHFAERLESDDIANLASSHILWDEVMSVRPVGPQPTYDVEVSHEPGIEPNFSVDDFVSHNSGIGITLANMVSQSYYLTVTKILQDQLLAEFGAQLVELRGRSSYPCTYWDRYGPTMVRKKILTKDKLNDILASRPNCTAGYCRTDANKSEQLTQYKCVYCFQSAGLGVDENGKPRKDGRLKVLPSGMHYSACPYYEQVEQAIQARQVVMNFHAFLMQTQMTKRFDLQRDLLICDECFHPHTRVQTDRGPVAIGKLVNERMAVRVKSYNVSTGQIEYKPVTRWLKRDKQMTYRVLAGNRVMYPTADHKVYIPSASGGVTKVKVGQLGVGDLVMTDETEINERQRQLVLGSLLGDATVQIVESKRVSKKYVNKGVRARVGFRHGPKQEAYINWKFRLMSPHAKTKPVLRPSKGFTKETLSFGTSCGFYDVVSVVMSGDRKTPTTAWLQKLDDFGLAVWYMDDGSLSSGVASFHTEGFTRSECETIAGWLVATYGFPARVLDAKKKDGRVHHFISIGRDGAQMLAKRIAKFVPPFMRYKLPEPAPMERLAIRTTAHDGWLVGTKQYHRVEYLGDAPVSGDIILLSGSDWRAADALADEIGGEVERVSLNPDGTVWKRDVATPTMIARTPLTTPPLDPYDESIENVVCRPVSAHPIRLIEPYKETVTYDLEVEGNHNYFAGATLVSNCHNAESILMDSVALVLDDRWLRRSKNLQFPNLGSASEYAIWFAENDVKGLIAQQYKEAKDRAAEPGVDQKEKRELVREMEELGRTYRKYVAFMDHMESGSDTEWVSETEDGKTFLRVVIKPVTVNEFADAMLFKHAKRVLLLSATILDAQILCKSLGIPKDQVASYRMKNRFPVESRPIYYEPVAKITGGPSAMGGWGPSLVKKMNSLAAKYPNERGIVHTHNFAIADLLYEGCSPAVRARFTYQKDDRFYDKQAMLEHHENTPGSIIIAPAMHEGLNLVGDLSRLQVICKVPYANFYDNRQLARRMEIDPRFYTWITALKIVQAYGRSVRSETDWAHTYVIDGAFERFCQTAKKMLPEWFKEAIVWGGSGK